MTVPMGGGSRNRGRENEDGRPRSGAGPEYSLNGGDWLTIDPTTRLTDSMEHDYRTLVDAATGEVTVAVRVNDGYEYQSVAKTVAR